MVDKAALKLGLPLARVSDWMARYRMTERQLDKAVINARARGASWQDIADAAELTRQGAQQRWGGKVEEAVHEASGIAKSQGRLAL